MKENNNNVKTYIKRGLFILLGILLLLIPVLLILNSCEEKDKQDEQDDISLIYDFFKDIGNIEYKKFNDIIDEVDWVDSLTSLTYDTENNKIIYTCRIFDQEQEQGYISLISLHNGEFNDINSSLSYIVNNLDYSKYDIVVETNYEHHFQVTDDFSSLLNENNYDQYTCNAFTYPNENILGISLIGKKDNKYYSYIYDYLIDSNKLNTFSSLICEKSSKAYLLLDKIYSITVNK